MRDLLKSEDASQWQAALDCMTERMPNLGKPRLDELESWFFRELPKQIHQADEPSLNGAQLVKTMEWKLTRGKWRPRLLDMVKKHSDELVVSTTRRAFAAAKGGSREGTAEYQDIVKRAVRILTELKGIGPATASALLAAFDPAFPFMSDEALIAATGEAKDYSLKMYLRFASALREKAEQLSSSERPWTAEDVEQALWSDAIQHTKKRKR